MKKILISFLVVASLAACQQRNSKTASEKEVIPGQDSSNYTSIQWIDSTFQDLGTVKEGPEVEVTYKFRNVGDAPLIIGSVTASCGCTIPETPKEPFGPGQEGVIRAKFTTIGHLNLQQKTITVRANTKGIQDHVLTFKIFVQPKS